VAVAGQDHELDRERRERRERAEAANADEPARPVVQVAVAGQSLQEEAEEERAGDVDGAGGERKASRMDRERLQQLVPGPGAQRATESDQDHLRPGAHRASL